MSQPPYPPPPPYAAFPPPGPERAPQPTNGLAIAALSIGVVTLVLSLIPYLNLVSAVVALVGVGLGVGGLFHARRHGNGRAMSWIGIVVCLLAVVVSVTITVLVTQDLWTWFTGEVEQGYGDE